MKLFPSAMNSEQRDHMGELLKKVYDELRQTPIVMLLVITLFGAVARLWTDHVSVADFRELKKELGGVRYTLRRDHADTRLHAVQAEMFTINQHIVEEKAKGHEVDTLYYKRLSDLLGQEEDVKREIGNLDRTPDGEPIEGQP